MARVGILRPPALLHCSLALFPLAVIVLSFVVIICFSATAADATHGLGLTSKAVWRGGESAPTGSHPSLNAVMHTQKDAARPWLRFLIASKKAIFSGGTPSTLKTTVAKPDQNVPRLEVRGRDLHFQLAPTIRVSREAHTLDRPRGSWSDNTPPPLERTPS